MENSSRNGLKLPANRNITLNAARNRCRKALINALDEGWVCVFSALMSMGKSYGVPHAVAATGVPSTVLTGRGHKEQYEQFLDWAKEAGIRAYRIPSFYHDCPTAKEEATHGEAWKSRVRRTRNRGVQPATIHEAMNPPCDRGEDCDYRRMMDFDPRDYDLLIGHYSHANFSPAIKNRAVFLDEFPGDVFETKVDPDRISAFLESCESIPFDNFTDLTGDPEESLVSETRRWIEDEGLTPSESEILDQDSLWSLAPVAMWGILTAQDLGNGWAISSFHKSDFTGELDDLVDWYRVAFDRKGSRAFVLAEPDFAPARNVIGLDGLPTMEMWATITDLIKCQQVLSDEERKSYITDALDHEYVLTTKYSRPYAPPEDEIQERIRVDRDAALLEAIKHRTNEKPGLITTKRAEDIFESQGLTALVDGHEHYGNLLGSNMFKAKRTGVVIGSRHFGDDYIKKWGAYADRSIEADRSSGSTDYGDFGNAILQHFREHQTLQAVMRFGRDGGGATVFVDTNTLPDWVPVTSRATVHPLSGKGNLSDVVEAASGNDSFTSSEISDWAGISESNSRRWLHILYEGGYVDRRRAGNGFKYSDRSCDDIDQGILNYSE